MRVRLLLVSCVRECAYMLFLLPFLAAAAAAACVLLPFGKLFIIPLLKLSSGVETPELGS